MPKLSPEFLMFPVPLLSLNMILSFGSICTVVFWSHEFGMSPFHLTRYPFWVLLLASGTTHVQELLNLKVNP